MVRPLVDPRLLATIADAFPQVLTIESKTDAQDAFGQPIATWANLIGHVAIACTIASAGGRETRRPDQTLATDARRALLAGYYATITPLMRAVAGGVTYDILAVEQDSQHLATILILEATT